MTVLQSFQLTGKLALITGSSQASALPLHVLWAKLARMSFSMDAMQRK